MRSGLRSNKSLVTVDHALSSISNALATALVARSSDASSLGIFSITFLAFWLVLGLTRALVAEPLLLFYAERNGELERSSAYTSRGAGATLTVGTCASVVFLVAAVLVPSFREALIPIGCMLPLLLLQDFGRYEAFARLSATRAIASDSIWLILILVAFPIADGLWQATWIWAASGAVACVAFRPRLMLGGLARTGRLDWFTEHRSSGGFLSLEFVTLQAISQSSIWLIAGLGSLASAGIYRTGQVLVAPGAFVGRIPDYCNASSPIRQQNQYASSAGLLAVRGKRSNGDSLRCGPSNSAYQHRHTAFR